MGIHSLSITLYQFSLLFMLIVYKLYSAVNERKHCWSCSDCGNFILGSRIVSLLLPSELFLPYYSNYSKSKKILIMLFLLTTINLGTSL